MEFEFDPAKSASNKAKHGIDFEEAQELWKDPDRALAPVLTGGEARFVAIGKIGDKVWRQFSRGATIASESFRFVARERTRSSVMKKFSAKAFDAKFDAGDDIDAFVDWAKMRRPGRDTRRVNVDFPGWIVEALDREAGRLGVTRQALVKLWIAERLDSAPPPSPVGERGRG